MRDRNVYTAIGLMTGTSLDGIDAALIETDGHDYVRLRAFVTIPYMTDLREALRDCFGQRDVDHESVHRAEDSLTLAHADIVKALMAQENISAANVDFIGFHGQTIFHAPEEKLTVQIGNGALLAAETGIDVVCKFRSADIRAGGQGAPLAPLYHRALIAGSKAVMPVVVLNIGGVANVTWIGPGGEDDLLAFDTGPGNALINDWVRSKTGAHYDKDGVLAAAGTVQDAILAEWLDHPYFKKPPPKSLDRDQWDIAAFGEMAAAMGGISLEDGAATLTEFTAETIIRAQDHMPQAPQSWYVCGGGRHNKALMAALRAKLPEQVALDSVDSLGWNGDATEAECFAYLAVRSALGLPLSLPGTTGVPAPQTGGIMHRAGDVLNIAHHGRGSLSS